jgi:hypothetical protein
MTGITTRGGRCFLMMWAPGSAMNFSNTQSSPCFGRTLEKEPAIPLRRLSFGPGHIIKTLTQAAGTTVCTITESLGAEYYEREYPNFASLISITGLDTAAGVATERWEKDYAGYIGRAGYSWIKPLGFSWETEYSLLYKDLDDKKVVNSNGVMTSEQEEAYVHSLDLNFWHTLDIDGGLRLGLDLNGTIYDSNQNFWDERIQGLFSTQKYTSDYYDSFSYRISPNISYTFALLPLTPSISYAYQRTDYSDRQAKFSNGDYKNSDEYQYEQEIEASLRYDFTDNWSIKGLWQTIVARSNNQDERVYRYDYQLDIFAIGVMYKY